jgi:hypothetical protein
MRNQTSDIAGVIFGLLLLVGLSQTYTTPPLGFDMADNPFHPWSIYNPSTETGTCMSDEPCQTWDFLTNLGAGAGTCQANTADTDGDSNPAYYAAPAPLTGDWSSTDAGCIVLEDWDQDGVCDHRVYDSDRNQVDTDYQPVLFYHQYVMSGLWNRIVSPGLCTGWVGV